MRPVPSFFILDLQRSCTNSMEHLQAMFPPCQLVLLTQVIFVFLKQSSQAVSKPCACPSSTGKSHSWASREVL